MEFKYTLTNKTTNKIETYTIRHNVIVASSNKRFIGSEIKKVIELYNIWGHDITVNKIEWVGLADIVKLISIVENLLPKERMYVKLRYPDGSYGFVEYDGSEEDRFRIIKEHTDLFRSKEEKIVKGSFKIEV